MATAPQPRGEPVHKCNEGTNFYKIHFEEQAPSAKGVGPTWICTVNDAPITKAPRALKYPAYVDFYVKPLDSSVKPEMFFENDTLEELDFPYYEYDTHPVEGYPNDEGEFGFTYPYDGFLDGDRNLTIQINKRLLEFDIQNLHAVYYSLVENPKGRVARQSKSHDYNWECDTPLEVYDTSTGCWTKDFNVNAVKKDEIIIFIGTQKKRFRWYSPNLRGKRPARVRKSQPTKQMTQPKERRERRQPWSTHAWDFTGFERSRPSYWTRDRPWHQPRRQRPAARNQRVKKRASQSQAPKKEQKLNTVRRRLIVAELSQH